MRPLREWIGYAVAAGLLAYVVFQAAVAPPIDYRQVEVQVRSELDRFK